MLVGRNRLPRTRATRVVGLQLPQRPILWQHAPVELSKVFHMRLRAKAFMDHILSAGKSKPGVLWNVPGWCGAGGAL